MGEMKEKLGAWKLPANIVAEVKALATVTNIPQRQLVATALGEWINTMRSNLPHAERRTVNFLRDRFLAEDTAGRQTE